MSAIDHTAYSPRACRSPSGRTRIRSQRPCAPSGAGDADLFLLALALARRLEQAEHRFRDVGIADEDALDRARILRGRGAGQRQIGGVGIDDVAPRRSVTARPSKAWSAMRPITGSSVVRSAKRTMPAAKANRLNRPTMASSASSAEDIGLGLGAAEASSTRPRTATMRGGHQQHQHDAAAAPRRLVRPRSGPLGGRMAVGLGGHIQTAHACRQ